MKGNKVGLSAVYKIVNTVTGDCYVGSSRNVKSRWKSHNGETLTLSALATRFHRAGIEHPVLEAKKYLKDD